MTRCPRCYEPAPCLRCVEPARVEEWPARTLTLTVASIALIMAVFNVAMWRLG